ncbi:sensor histidine kinase [Actinomadura fibrosa]|uniref:histidine kinase n=1 Tax=Actinomadura fibrosa TaxID=111802 RepID=A0ABW2XXR5_9ACTN|nr:histidine kinase [Actinomadura fibrosa]
MDERARTVSGGAQQEAGPGSRPAAFRAAVRRGLPEGLRSAGRDGAWRALPGAVQQAARAAVRRPSRSALVKDMLLFAVLAFPVAVGLLTPLEAGPALWAEVLGLMALAGAIAVSRAWPLAALVTVVALILVHGNFAFGLPVLSYLAGLRMSRARPVLWGFTGVFALGVTLNLVRDVAVTTWFPLTIWLVLLGVLPWLAGRYWQQYQELLRAGWDRADRLEREQRIIAERERLRERARIARDMHDSLGHELALIAVRAGALQVAAGLDERHRAAAAELRAGAADATERLREIIGVLREEPGPASDPDGTVAGGAPGAPGEAAARIRPAGESVPELVERARASGVPVRLAGEDGAARGSLPDMPPMVGLAVHRVVQEGITNAAKHAPGAAVTVDVLTRVPVEAGVAAAATASRVEVMDPADAAGSGVAGSGAAGAGGILEADRPGSGGVVVVRVVNGPPPGGPPLLPPGGGLGLTGLAERVRLAGGTLRAGPDPAGGFEVVAELPVDGPPSGPLAASSGKQGSASATALMTALGLVSTGPNPGHPGRGAVPGAIGGSGEWLSESARHLARERRQVRRGLITAIAVPAGLIAALGAVMAGYYVYVAVNSVLPASDYAALRVGDGRARVERVLPPMETADAGAVRFRVPEPAGADCRYYRPDANLLGVARVYRLCFTGDRLSAKDVFGTQTTGRDAE